MTSLERHRQVLLDALGVAWDKAVVGIETESRVEFERLASQLQQEQTTIQKLQQEISILRAKVVRQSGDEQSVNATTVVKSTSPADDQPAQQHGTDHDHEWKRKYCALDAKYQALKSVFGKAKELLRSRTESRKEWINYADWLEANANGTNSGEEPAPRPSRDGAPRMMNDQAGPEPHALSAPPKRPSQSFSSEVEVSADKVIPSPSSHDAAGVDLEAAPVPGHNDAPLLPLLRTARDGQVTPPMKREPSSDEPVEISHHIVRKRKLGNESTEARARRIKAEVPHSSPDPVRTMDSYETVTDLDNSVNLVTPRRRQPGNHIPVTEPVSPSPDDRPGMLVEASTLSSEPPANSTAISKSFHPPALPPDALGLGGPTTPLTKFTKPVASSSKARTMPQTRPMRRAEPLQEISPNKQIRSVADGVSKGAHKSKPGRAVRSLAEDELSSGSSGSKGQPITPGRLDGLLNTPRNGAGAKGLSFSAPRPRLQQEGDGHLIPGRRLLPWGKETRGQKAVTGQQAISSTADEPTTRRRTSDNPNPGNPNGGLRDKPQSELRLDDFKINPRSNSGESFAFSEVVRGREERAALPGCTDPNCCGKEFRAMALAERPPPPHSAAQRAEENQLLQDYLGDAAYRIPTLDPDERDEMWLEAKARQLANKFGRHKHRFHRAASPPGFWNADFPTTQEMQDERRQAHEKECGAVMERYREAMRPGGRWLFRDE